MYWALLSQLSALIQDQRVKAIEYKPRFEWNKLLLALLEYLVFQNAVALIFACRTSDMYTIKRDWFLHGPNSAIISWTADVNWPPSSCDLMPLVYFLWGAVGVMPTNQRQLRIWWTTIVMLLPRHTIPYVQKSARKLVLVIYNDFHLQ